MFWLFRRVRMESMERYRVLSDAIGVLRDPQRFFDSDLYHDSLKTLEEFILTIAEGDGLPYTLYPESRPSAIVASADYRALVGAMEGTLLERFLQDYIGFTLRLELYDVIAFSATNSFQLASSLFIGRALKRAGVRAHLVLGGHAVSLAGPNLIEDKELSGCIDSIVVQGGADVFCRVCRDVTTLRARPVYSSHDIQIGFDDKGFSQINHMNSSSSKTSRISICRQIRFFPSTRRWAVVMALVRFAGATEKTPLTCRGRSRSCSMRCNH